MDAGQGLPSSAAPPTTSAKDAGQGMPFSAASPTYAQVVGRGMPSSAAPPATYARVVGQGMPCSAVSPAPTRPRSCLGGSRIKEQFLRSFFEGGRGAGVAHRADLTTRRVRFDLDEGTTLRNRGRMGEDSLFGLQGAGWQGAMATVRDLDIAEQGAAGPGGSARGIVAASGAAGSVTVIPMTTLVAAVRVGRAGGLEDAEHLVGAWSDPLLAEVAVLRRALARAVSEQAELRAECESLRSENRVLKGLAGGAPDEFDMQSTEGGSRSIAGGEAARATADGAPGEYGMGPIGGGSGPVVTGNETDRETTGGEPGECGLGPIGGGSGPIVTGNETDRGTTGGEPGEYGLGPIGDGLGSIVTGYESVRATGYETVRAPTGGEPGVCGMGPIGGGPIGDGSGPKVTGRETVRTTTGGSCRGGARGLGVRARRHRGRHDEERHKRDLRDESFRFWSRLRPG